MLVSFQNCKNPQHVFITAYSCCCFFFLQHPQICCRPSFLLHWRDALTRNGLQCFPAPVNRLPACEGIDGFDIGCCLTQKRRRGPRDSPFLTLHIHHAGQSNGWDAGLVPEGEESRGERREPYGESKGEGGRFLPGIRAAVTTGPPTAFSHLRRSILNSLLCHAPSCCDC